MPWKKTAGGENQLTGVEFSGSIVKWAEVVKQSYANYFTVDLFSWLLFMTKGFANEARVKWQSGWFSKGKLDGLQKLENPNAYNPFNVLDYLAEHLDIEDRYRMKEKAFDYAFNICVSLTHERNPLMALFLKATQEKSYSLYDKPNSSRHILTNFVKNPRFSEITFHSYISMLLKEIAHEDMARAFSPEAPVIKKITPLLKENADGTITDPFKLFDELSTYISVEMNNSKGTYLQKVIDNIFVV